MNCLFSPYHRATWDVFDKSGPAVSASGHGLNRLRFFQILDEGVASVVASLVAMNNGFIVKATAVILNQLIHSVKHKVHFQAQAYTICQNLVGKGIEDRGEITLALCKEQIGNVGQQHFPCPMRCKLPVDHIGRYIASLHGLGHPAIRVRSSDRAAKVELVHQPADFLHIHDNPCVKKPHMNASRTFGITVEAICFKNQV